MTIQEQLRNIELTMVQGCPNHLYFRECPSCTRLWQAREQLREEIKNSKRAGLSKGGNY